MHTILIILGFLYIVLAQDDCSLGDDGTTVYCLTSVTTSTTKSVTLSRTSIITSTTTAPLTSVSIEPTVTSQPYGQTQSSTPSASAVVSTNHPHPLKPGAKAGIAIGVIVIFCLFGAVSWFSKHRAVVSKRPKGTSDTEAAEKTNYSDGSVLRPELEATDVQRDFSYTNSNRQGQSVHSYQSEARQEDYPVAHRASGLKPTDELFFPPQEQRAARKPAVYITNADIPPEQEHEPQSPTRSDPGRPRVLSIGQPPGEVALWRAARSPQEDQRCSTPQRGLHSSSMSALVEKKRQIDEQIAEARRLTGLYQQKDEIQAQIREEEKSEGETKEEKSEGETKDGTLE
ncbi:MAG: hypothetical protein M1821_001798 [Bathelium mastoideum]|nr:MAG: hypothetical protein M1821_001798 [Bathelium mastoideum]